MSFIRDETRSIRFNIGPTKHSGWPFCMILPNSRMGWIEGNWGLNKYILLEWDTLILLVTNISINVCEFVCELMKANWNRLMFSFCVWTYLSSGEMVLSKTRSCQSNWLGIGLTVPVQPFNMHNRFELLFAYSNIANAFEIYRTAICKHGRREAEGYAKSNIFEWLEGNRKFRLIGFIVTCKVISLIHWKLMELLAHGYRVIYKMKTNTPSFVFKFV